jgi:GNAT superfamily N-acetyltransferase
MSQLTIRLARMDEIRAIHAVHRDSVTSLCTSHYTPEQIATWLDGRTPEIYVDGITSGQLWVAIGEDETIAGFVEIHGHVLGKLFVRGASAGSGVGRRLLATAVDAIKATGAASVYLEASRNARDFYRKHGFVEIGTGMFSPNSRVALEVVKMELVLSPPD